MEHLQNIYKQTLTKRFGLLQLKTDMDNNKGYWVFFKNRRLLHKLRLLTLRQLTLLEISQLYYYNLS